MTQPDTVRYHGDLAKRLVDAGKVHPHPDNPKIGNVDAIVDSLVRNGCYRPLVVQKSTGHILAGNHTFKALVRLGEPKVPVLYVDVDDITAKRILAVDNRASDLGTYDDEALLALLVTINEDEHGLEGTGYGDTDLDDLQLLLEASSDATERMFAAMGTDAHRNETDEEEADRAEKLSQHQSLSGQGLAEVILILSASKKDQLLDWIDKLRKDWGHELTNGEVVYAALGRLVEKVQS